MKVYLRQRTISVSYIIFFLFIFFNTILANNKTIPDSIKTTNRIHVEYPAIELSGGVGLSWLFQVNLTLSPYKHIYFQPRFSSSLIANEAGYVIGYQNRLEESLIIRIGVGYSKGEAYSLDPGGGPTNRWGSLYFRIGTLKKISEKSIVNPNINIIKGKTETILSFNINFVIILF